MPIDPNEFQSPAIRINGTLIERTYLNSFVGAIAPDNYVFPDYLKLLKNTEYYLGDFRR